MTHSFSDIYNRQQKLLRQRNEAVEEKKKAEDIIANPNPQMSTSDLEYWQDRIEYLKAHIAYLDSNVVQLKVEMSKLAGSGKLRSIFTRHRISRLDQSRFMILYLLDQVVKLRYVKIESDREKETLEEALKQHKQDLRDITRQSLMIQRTVRCPVKRIVEEK